jgi:ectoine hydroxylase-related dioxygenase (phytanoyl-CoA dioxygenase family)
MIWGLHAYSKEEFDFPRAVAAMFGTRHLESLGQEQAQTTARLLPRNDQSTVFHRQFYERYDEYVADLYRAFVAKFVADLIGTRQLCYQQVPTFRIHLPGNVAVGEFHRDAEYHHQDGEMNFWLPLTPAWGTNSLWVETAPYSERYHPVQAQPGEVYVFDGVHLRHGNKLNRTGVSRVSFDFRCIPSARFRDSGLRTVAAGRRLSIGDYFAEL